MHDSDNFIRNGKTSALLQTVFTLPIEASIKEQNIVMIHFAWVITTLTIFGSWRNIFAVSRR
jgi:hypothetical protein